METKVCLSRNDVSFVELCYDVNTRVFVFRLICVLYIHNLLCFRHTVTITNNTDLQESLAHRTLQKMLKGKQAGRSPCWKSGQQETRHKLQSYSTYIGSSFKFYPICDVEGHFVFSDSHLIKRGLRSNGLHA